MTPAAPVAPTGLKAAAAPGGVGTVTLSWTAPANAALADVAKYQYRSSSGGSWMDIAGSASLTMYAVTGLQPGTSYEFSLRAVNSAGAAGPASASAPVSTTPTTPSSPRGLSAEPGEGSATLRWADPSNATITRYEYRWKRDGGAYSTWTALPGSGASTTTASLSGLTAGDVRVSAARGERGRERRGVGGDADGAGASGRAGGADERGRDGRRERGAAALDVRLRGR